LVKLKTSQELDAVLEEASAKGTTLVIGALGAGYDGVTARNALTKAAFDLRDPLRLQFYEVGVNAANAATLFSKDTPFSITPFSYAVVLPAKWLAKGEAPYVQSADWKKLHNFIPSHAFPRVYPLVEQYRTHVAKQGTELLATLLYDQKGLSKKQRYILKQIHKLLQAEPELTSHFAFAVSEVSPFREPWLLERFDRTTVNGKFFGKFAEEYPLRNFVMIVSNLSSSENWLVESNSGATPEGLDSLAFTSPLQAISDGNMPALPQGSAAAAAAGLKEMAMGFGGDQGGGLMEVGPDGNPIPNKKKKSKKAKRKGSAAKAKDEV